MDCSRTLLRLSTLSSVCLVVVCVLANDALAVKTSSNLTEVVTATFIGGKGTEWFSAGVFPGDDSIVLGGISLSPELTLLGVKAKVYGKDAPALPAPGKFLRLGSKDTGRIALPKAKDATEVEDPLADDDDDLGLSLEEPATKKEVVVQEKKKREELTSVPRRLQFYTQTGVEAREVYARLTWQEPAATGFIGRFDPGLKRVRALYRFPRGSCGITGMSIAKDGALYVVGFANDRIHGACGDCRVDEHKWIVSSGTDYGGDRHAFLAKLSPDLGSVIWIRELKYKSYAPKVQVLHDGNIVIMGPAYMVYSPEGKLVRATPLRKTRVESGSSIDPVTGRFTMVGDWLGMTGREPMRVPRLLIHRPDGIVHKQLQAWGANLFCPNHFHNVADSAVRRSAWDDRGNMIYSTWSHGGNNVNGRLPYDCETRIPDRMNHTGGQTYVYCIKLGPEQNVKCGMLWGLAGNIDTLAMACDGSPVWVGNWGGNGLPNRLTEEQFGDCIVVTEPNMASYRFYGKVPAVGTHVALAGCNSMVDRWAFASGKCAGRPMLLCLSGAGEKLRHMDKTYAPPQKNAVQPGFGGGLTDGYALLMDLTPKTELAYELAPAPPPKPPRPPKLGPDGKPLPREGVWKIPKLWPYEGQKWTLLASRIVTGTIVVRDSAEEKWPNFFTANPLEGGTFVYSESNKTHAAFTIASLDIKQTFGEQGQRVLGELLRYKWAIDPEKGTPKCERLAPEPTVKVHVTATGPWERTIERYGLRAWPICRGSMDAKLEFNGQMVEVTNMPCKAVFQYPHRDKTKKYAGANYSLMETRFAVPGEKLGLKPPLADRMIKFRVAWEASTDVETTPIIKEKIKLPKVGEEPEDEDDLGLL